MLILFFCSDQSCFKDGKEYTGSEISNSKANDVCDCQSKCQALSNCVAFDFKTNDDCSLKSALGSLNDDGSKVAGLKNCQSTDPSATATSGGF